MSTITEPDLIEFTAAAVTRTGGLRPGTWAVVMTMSIAGDHVVELGLLCRRATPSANAAGEIALAAGTDNNSGTLQNGFATGSITMTSGTSVTTGTGLIALLAPNNIAVSRLDAGTGKVLVWADWGGVNNSGTFANLTGAITDNLTGESANLTGDAAILRAGSGIGTDAADIDSTLNKITAITESGDINIDNTQVLIIGNGLDGGLSLSLTGCLNTVTTSLAGIAITDTVNDNSAADNVTLTAANGGLTVDANNSVVNNDGGNILLAAEGTAATDDLSIDADITATGGSGSVLLYAGDDLSIKSGTVSAEASGAIRLSAGETNNGTTGAAGNAIGDIVLMDGTLLQTTAGQVELEATGSIAISRLITDGDIFVSADDNDFAPANNIGAITDNTIAEGPGSENLVGENIDLRAATGIGSAIGMLGDTGDLDTAATTLNAVNTTSGAIQIAETNGVAVNLLSNANRTIVLDAGGAITDGNGNTAVDNVVAQDLVLRAIGGIGIGNALEIGVTNLAFANTGSGNVQFSDVGGVTVTSLGGLTSSSNTVGAITMTATGAVTFDASTTASGTIDVTVADSAAVSTDNISVNSSVTVKSTAGDVFLQAGDRISLAAPSTVEATNGSVTLSSGFGDIDDDGSQTLNGMVKAANRITVNLNAETDSATEGASGSLVAANLLLLSTGAGTFTMDASETNNVVTLAANVTGAVAYRNLNALTIGTVGSTEGITTTDDNVTICLINGNLTLAESISTRLAGETTGIVRLQTLDTTGSITQSSGNVTAASLGLRAGSGGISFNSASNDVDVLAATTTGTFSFVDADGFTLGTVTALGCFTPDVTGLTVGGDLEICVTTGAININAAVNAGSGTIRLQTGGGSILQNASGVITAANLGARATGGVDLNAAVNAVATTFSAASTTAGVIEFRNGNGFTVGTISNGSCFVATTGITTQDGNVDLLTTVGGITLSNVVTAQGDGNVTLNAAGLLTVNAAVSSTTGDLILTGGTGVTHNAAGDLTTGTAGANVGTIGVTATTGSITMADGTVYSTGGGAVTLLAAANAVVGEINTASGTVSVTATSGNITDITSAETANATGGTVILKAGTRIGNATTAGDIDTAATVLRTDSGTGGTYVTEFNGVQLGDGVSGNTSTGPMVIVAGGTITTGNATTTTANDSSISVRTTAGGVTLSNVVTAHGDGNLTLNAAGLLTVNAAVSSTTGDLSVTGGTGVTHNAAGDLTTTGVGTIGVTATTNDITMADGTVYSTGSGTVTLLAGTNVKLGQIITTSSAINVTATAGAITDNTASETANLITNTTATLSAATGIGSAGGTGDIDTTIGTLVTSNTVSGNIFIQETNGLIVGTGGVRTLAGNGNINIDLDAGSLTVNDVVSAHGSGTVTLNVDAGTVALNAAIRSTSGAIDVTGGAVNQNAGGNISTGSTGTVDVTANNGSITMASGTTTTSGSGAITYDATDSVALSGLTSTSGAINVTADSDLSGAGAITDQSDRRGSEPCHQQYGNADSCDGNRIVGRHSRHRHHSRHAGGNEHDKWQHLCAGIRRPDHRRHWGQDTGRQRKHQYRCGDQRLNGQPRRDIARRRQCDTECGGNADSQRGRQFNDGRSKSDRRHGSHTQRGG